MSYDDSISNLDRFQGRLDMIPVALVSAFMGAVLAIGVIKLNDYTTDQNSSNDIASETFKIQSPAP